MSRLGCCLLAVATAHAFVAPQPLPWAQVPALAHGAGPRALRVSLYTLAMAKKKGKDEVKSVSSAAAPTRSAAAIIAEVRQALAVSGNGFQSSAADLERVAALLGDLEDQNGVCPARFPVLVWLRLARHRRPVQRAHTASAQTWKTPAGPQNCGVSGGCCGRTPSR
jgi:hypothetical protein